MSKLDPYRDEIAAWLDEGRGYAWISNRLLLDYGLEVDPSTICTWRQKQGLKCIARRGQQKKLNAEQVARLKQAKADGVSWADLEARFGISRLAVWKYLRHD